MTANGQLMTPNFASYLGEELKAFQNGLEDLKEYKLLKESEENNYKMKKIIE